MADDIDFGPVCVAIPVGRYSEPDLIAALDLLMGIWHTHNCDAAGKAAQARAARWLREKYAPSGPEGGES